MPLGQVPADVSADALAYAQRSFALSKAVLALRSDNAAYDDLYTAVLNGIVSNVKTQPGGFTATSGVVLAYYLNLSTNFMDPNVAPKLVELVCATIVELVLPTLQVAEGERLVIVGMEVAGGMLVSQLAAATGPFATKVKETFDFVYMRKTRKSTGTAQQLEGTKIFTSRTADSPRMRAVWVDDCNSTGGSLCDGISILEEDYNIDVVHALYVVDRSADRKLLAASKQKLSDDRFVSGHTTVSAIMDLAEVDTRITRDA